MEFCKFHLMKAKRFMILVHPVFIVSLLLLLLNDNYLKEEYHNGLTGKLSDVTGLILLSLLFFIFTGTKIWAVLLSAAFFIWWKSPLSTPVIDLLNGFFNIDIQRVADVSDLITLPAVLIVYAVKPHQVIEGETIKKLGAIASGCFCLFAFCRTSQIRQVNYNLRDQEVRINEYFETKMSEDDIFEKFQRLNITFYKDSIRFYPLRKTELYYHDSLSSSLLPLHWPQNSRNPELYERRVESYYVIPEYTVNGERITDIEFYIYPGNENHRKSSVRIESIRTKSNPFLYDDKGLKKLRKIKKELKKLFKE